MNILEIKNLHATLNNIPILKGINLEVKVGETHAIMGPNGSGKSTLAKIIAGFPEFSVTDGSVSYEINARLKNLLTLAPDERAREGIFLGYQHPTEVPGVSNFEFLRAAFNSCVAHQGGKEMDSIDFNDFLQEKLKFLKLDDSLPLRQVNVGLSGGEKKRNELLQLAVLSPRLALLDEVDSGLDVDSLKVVSEGINKLRSNDRAFVLITHYQRLLNYIVPDFVHVLHDGKIIKTGDKDLAKYIENKGYESLIAQ